MCQPLLKFSSKRINSKSKGEEGSERREREGGWKEMKIGMAEGRMVRGYKKMDHRGEKTKRRKR